jgi:hypothetical protein
MSLIFLLFPVSVSAIEWAKTYGDTAAQSIQQTTDGGYIVAGATGPFVYDLDALVMKLDSSGNIDWQKTYGDRWGAWDKAKSIQQTADGGYIVAGYFERYLWVFKLDSSGTIDWQKAYGVIDSPYTYEARSIQQTADGGYIVAGATFEIGYKDALVMKLDSSGNIDWQKIYVEGAAQSIQQTADGCYIVAGFDGGNIWVLKLDNSGNVVWRKTYAGDYLIYTFSLQQTADGGYIVAGGSGDFWVLKLDESGNVVWHKTYGGNGNDQAQSIQQTADGGYIVAGLIDFSYTGGVDYADVWVFKLDESGNVVWQKTYGGVGESYDVANSVQQTADGGFIVACVIGDFSTGPSSFGSLILKLDSNGEIPGCGIMHTSDALIMEPSLSVEDTSVEAQTMNATISSFGVSTQNSSAEMSNLCESALPCTTWTDVISKYNLYVSGSANWDAVITCYNQYAAP